MVLTPGRLRVLPWEGALVSSRTLRKHEGARPPRGTVPSGGLEISLGGLEAGWENYGLRPLAQFETDDLSPRWQQWAVGVFNF